MKRDECSVCRTHTRNESRHRNRGRCAKVAAIRLVRSVVPKGELRQEVAHKAIRQQVAL